MTIKTFWLILLKTLGIILVVSAVSVLANTFSTLSYIYKGDLTSVVYVIVAVIATVLLYFLVLWLFVFKTSWLIDKLSLEKGFDEEKIDLNIRPSTILRIATIVTGGIMVVNNLPFLCKEGNACTSKQFAIVVHNSSL